MKKIKILISCVLIIASVLSVGILPSVAEEPTPNIYQTVVYNEYNTPIYRCYIGDAYFNYDLSEKITSRYDSHIYKGLEKYNHLYIYNFSDNFPRTVEIPGVIEGKEIHYIDIYDYSFINTLILPDSLRMLDFSGYENRDADRPSYERVYQPGYENPIQELHLGKNFSEYGLLQAINGGLSNDRHAGGLKFLQKITVSEENPYLVVKDNYLFTKDMKKLVLRPAFRDWTDGRGYTLNGISPFIGKRSLTIGSGAFAHSIIKKLVLTKEVGAIESSAFYNSYASSITIPKTVKTIGAQSFNSNFLEKLTIKCDLNKSIKQYESKKANKKIPFFKGCANAKIYVKNKSVAKTLLKTISKKAKNYKNIGARIYVGKKLIYKVK